MTAIRSSDRIGSPLALRAAAAGLLALVGLAAGCARSTGSGPPLDRTHVVLQPTQTDGSLIVEPVASATQD